MATGVGFKGLRDNNGRKLKQFLNGMADDVEMTFLTGPGDRVGEIKKPTKLEIYDQNTNKTKQYTNSQVSRSYSSVLKQIMAQDEYGNFILSQDDVLMWCQEAGNNSYGRYERIPTPWSSLAKTAMFGGHFGVVGAGGRDTETKSEVLVMYCLGYKLATGKFLKPQLSGQNAVACPGFNVGKDLDGAQWPAVSRLLDIPSGTFSFNNQKDREELVTFAYSKAVGKFKWIQSAITSSQLIVKNTKMKRGALIVNDKFFATGSRNDDPYKAFLNSGNKADANKWNPADIWIFNTVGTRNMEQFNRQHRDTTSIPALNLFLANQWKDGNIFPISLKKVNPARQNFSVVNGNEYVERIAIKRQRNPPIIEFTDKSEGGSGGNRDVKINFTLETVKLKPGMTAQQAQRQLFSNIGEVDHSKDKKIRIKFKANTRGIDIEYSQTGSKDRYSEAKGGTIGATLYTKIISGTSQQGIRHLNTLKSNYDNTDLKLDKHTTAFTSNALHLGPINIDDAFKYLDDIWTTINSDSYNSSYLSQNRKHLQDKIIAGEIGVSIHMIQNERVKRSVVQNLYNACASIGIGVGVPSLNIKSAQGAPLPLPGIGIESIHNYDFYGGIHGKVY